ncbi:hypothetical protein [Microscilla marina]|uniref:Uncharacterized protein n=1 Tax=Microscilla marina ATCC 23134 TaxID=313606 RepID=A1ZLT0_MICM2|nr:hypothetical protein [Microscilla marina]EAY28834.1 hypothetical protein M23134_07932 [Microscilla marina ATCC 23134]
MRIYLLLTLVTLFGLFFFQCKSTSANKNDDPKNATLKKLGEEKYGASAHYIPSPGKSYVLCYKKEKGNSVKSTQKTVDFFVFETQSNKTVYENNLQNGYVKWFSDYQLEMFLVPGIMPANKSKDDFITIYNLKNNTSIKKSTITGGNKD